MKSAWGIPTAKGPDLVPHETPGPPGTIPRLPTGCAAGERVLLMRYLGVGHDAADVSAGMAIGWIEDVFAGRPTGTICPS